MADYIMALDQGTTSSRAIIFDKEGRICSVKQKEFTQHFPNNGWVEHDPMEIWATQMSVMMEARETMGIRTEDIAAIGITNQSVGSKDRQSGVSRHSVAVQENCGQDRAA